MKSILFFLLVIAFVVLIGILPVIYMPGVYADALRIGGFQ